MNDGEAIDIPTMAAMDEQDYRTYITTGGGGMLVGTDDVLRDSAGRPLATSLEQFDILLGVLSGLRKMMVPRRTL